MINFDERASGWDDDPEKVERAARVAEAIRKQIRLSPEMTALEYGCGTGLLSFNLGKSVGHITLADNSTGMLAVLSKKITTSGMSNMTPLKLDLSTDPIPGERYDLIYTLMTLHHIPDISVILQSFYTLLKPEGTLCVADLDQEDGSFHGKDFQGHKGFNRDDLEHTLLNTGFKNIRFGSIYNMRRRVEDQTKEFSLFLVCAGK